LSGLFFLIVYVCISAFSVIACCMCLNHRKDYANEPETFRRMLNVFMTCRSLAINKSMARFKLQFDLLVRNLVSDRTFCKGNILWRPLAK